MPDTLSRTLPSTRRTLGDVDPAQPLDTTHPLTDGLQGFWLPLPHLTGGSRLYDLSAFRRHATINHGAGAWRNGTFNTPSLVFGGDQTDDYAFLSSPPVDIGVTVSVYISVPQSASVSTSRYDQVFRFGQDDILLASYSNYLSASGQAQGKIWDGSDEHEVVGTDIRGQGPTLLTMTWGVGGMKLYENGVQVDSNSFTGSPNPLLVSVIPTEDQDIIIGWADKNSDSFEGQIAHAYWADRSLSPRQVSVLYDQARRGFPDLLNRRDSVGLLGGGGGGTTAIVVNSDFSGRAGTVGSDLAVKQALQSTLSGAVGTVGSDVAVRQALESTLSGAPGTLSATTRALPSITTDLQGNQGTFASGIASIAAVEAAMTGRPGSLTSQAAVLQALNAGLSGQAGTLNIQLSTSQLTSAQVDISGAKGSLSSTLAARLALQSALQGASGTISAEVGIPLSLDADFAGARGDLVATLGDFRTLDATLEGRPGTLSVAAEVIQRLQATLQGAAGDSTAVARVTQAVSASLEGRPGQLTSILGDIGALATIDARLRDELKIDAILDDALSIDADLTD